ncbi:HAD hydrolase family protein [Brachybacterium huguangmaarense]
MSADQTPTDGRRAVFLDFDGTYADHGVVPNAHADAVRRARARGHVVLLCTGRPVSILTPDVTSAFDGVVSSAGARVDLAGTTLADERLDPEVARRAIDVLERHEASYCLEAPEAMFAPERSIGRLRAMIEALLDSADTQASSGARTVLDAIRVPEDPRTCSFAKISVWDTGNGPGIHAIADEIGEGLRALPNSVTGDAARSGELQNARIDKADGVALVARHLGLPITATIGAGDGMNDVGMLEAAGTAIGIEGAPDAVLAHADLVVPGPARTGLVGAFERLGLM